MAPKFGPKTRVYELAQQLGVDNKQVIAAAADIGLVKVAVSVVNAAEATAIWEIISASHSQEAAPEVEEKLRTKVEKDVANEVQQIVAGVDQKLAQQLADAEVAAATLADGSAGVAAAEPALAADAEEDPYWEEETANDFFAPVFLAPQTRGRQSMVAISRSEDIEYEDETDDPEYHARALAKEREQAAERKGKTRRGTRGKSRGRGAEESAPIDAPMPLAIKGSTRLEAKRRRREERRDQGRQKRHIVSEAEFLARRESVDRQMIVREAKRQGQPGYITQVGVLEDGLLVEHFVTSDAHNSIVGNIYLGRVQNVLPSMEAAFIDFGSGRNGVLYAGEVDWRAAGLGGRQRRIEQALKPGDQVLVQVTKDPVGHKGARLTTQISLAGRYLVYVPGGKSTGISRKLPEAERQRLKGIIRGLTGAGDGIIIRTAAEGVEEAEIRADVHRLQTLWETIETRTKEEKEQSGASVVTLYEEPDMLVKVVRDLFNEDFSQLVVEGSRAWNIVHAYVASVASDLEPRLVKYDPAEHGDKDVFEQYRIEEQLQKALSRKVWLPSGGTLVIDRTEAMTVIDVNTGKFTGAGGNLEETVTKNNLEAAEEIVRQMRLRDIGGMIVVDFIDMVLPQNQDLVLRRLKEALGRDRTRHEVSEVTSLGLVQMTRKKLGTGLLETFATECPNCRGRGVIVHHEPVDYLDSFAIAGRDRRTIKAKQGGQHASDHPVARAMSRHHEAEEQQAPKPRRSKVAEADLSVPPRKPRRSRESMEQLADVVAGAIITGPAEPEVAAESPAQPVTSGRRRRRAVKAQAATTAAAVQAVAEPEDVAVPEVAAAEVAAPAAQRSYEEALAEFERSPRRRRAVRGNSISDVPPNPADFGVDPEVTFEQAEPPARTGRTRRATKRTSAAKKPAPVQAEAPVSTPEPEVHVVAAGAEEATSAAPATRRRTRRRAVRTGTATAAPAQVVVTEPQVAEPQAAEQPVGAEKAARGRRRAVRKATRK